MTDNMVFVYQDDYWTHLDGLNFGPRHYHGAFVIDGKIFTPHVCA